MSVLIPDDILRATKMTEDELKLEIAIMLYKQEKISSGKARAWTGLTVIEFQHELAKRGLCLNYDVEDFPGVNFSLIRENIDFEANRLCAPGEKRLPTTSKDAPAAPRRPSLSRVPSALAEGCG